MLLIKQTHNDASVLAGPWHLWFLSRGHLSHLWSHRALFVFRRLVVYPDLLSVFYLHATASTAAATACKYMTSFSKHRRDPKFAWVSDDRESSRRLGDGRGRLLKGWVCGLQICVDSAVLTPAELINEASLNLTYTRRYIEAHMHPGVSIKPNVSPLMILLAARVVSIIGPVHPSLAARWLQGGPAPPPSSEPSVKTTSTHPSSSSFSFYLLRPSVFLTLIWGWFMWERWDKVEQALFSSSAWVILLSTKQRGVVDRQGEQCPLMECM